MLLFAFLLRCISVSSWGSEISPHFMQPKVVYGEDNRKDIYLLPSSHPARLLSQSVAAHLDRIYVRHEEGSALVKVNTGVYGERKHLCPDERFWSQPTAPSCTAFLVRPDIMASAAHCFVSTPCDASLFVFGFVMENRKQMSTQIPLENIYGCKRLEKIVFTSEHEDFALIRLDRPVTDRPPLTLAESVSDPEWKLGQKLFNLGFPSGLPLKLTDGTELISMGQGFFKMNLDSFGGSSGSPVFTESDQKVRGILVRGETDFKLDGEKNCYRVNHCPDHGTDCRYEDATDIEVVRQALAQIDSPAKKLEQSSGPR